MTDGSVATAVPTVADWPLPAFTAMLPASPAVPVAVNETGLPLSPADVALRLFGPAAVASVQLPTVAMPLALLVWLAPVMLPFPGVTENVTATPATGFPLASLTITEGGIGTAAPAGSVWLLPALIAICVALPATIANGALVTVRPVAVARSVYPEAAWSMLRSENVATPLTAATVFVPESVSPPGFAASDTVTFPVKLVTVAPCASCAATCTAGSAAPATPSAGCGAKARCDAASATRKSRTVSALPRSESHKLVRPV